MNRTVMDKSIRRSLEPIETTGSYKRIKKPADRDFIEGGLLVRTA